MIKRLAPAALALVLAVPAVAHDYKAGDLVILHPWARATTPGAKVGAAYLVIQNKGGTPDRLVSVTAPFAERVEMHETRVEEGVAKMRPLAGALEIKPGEALTFEPGAKHLMFIGLKAPLAQGSNAPGELVFEKAGKVPVEFTVEAFGATPKAGDMGGMEHGR